MPFFTVNDNLLVIRLHEFLMNTLLELQNYRACCIDDFNVILTGGFVSRGRFSVSA